MKIQMNLQDTQRASLVVLKELDRICIEKNYKYWITFGTLIGAIRHKGFIPWDDDIDIAMPRDDYDKLIDYLNNEYNNDEFEIHTFLNNDTYPFYISRFCDKKHELVFDGYNYKSGCFVDIYPYDGMGQKEDYEYWKSIKPKLHSLTKKLIMSEQASIMYGSSLIHKFGNLPQLLVSKIFGRKYYYNRLDSYRKKYTWDESDFVGVICWSTGTYCYPKEWFSEFERIPFEDIEVNAPKEYDQILRFLYGDYMQLPPEEKRVPQHGFTAYRNE